MFSQAGLRLIFVSNDLFTVKLYTHASVDHRSKLRALNFAECPLIYEMISIS